MSNKNRIIFVRIKQGTFKMFTDYKDPIEVGAPLYLDEKTGKVTLSGEKLIGYYDIKNIENERRRNLKFVQFILVFCL